MEHNEKTLQERVSILEGQVKQLQSELAELKSAQVEESSIVETESLPFEVTEAIEPVIITPETELPPTQIIEEKEIATSDEILTEVVQSPVEPEPEEETVDKLVAEPAEEPASQPALPKAETYSKKATEAQKPAVSLESKIGKKLIPIAGSALILIALVLFGSLIRPHLTNGVKATIMAALSLGISAFGLIKMKPESKYRTFYSALAGCGVSACYISALVAHFSLDVLSEAALMACVSIWIICLILLSKFKSQMFTYICYIGILIAAAMTIQRWNDSPIGLIAYLLSITALFAANFSKTYKKVWWYFIQLPVILFPMSFVYGHDHTSQAIIFATTVLALFGQTTFYIRQSKESQDFTLTTVLSIPTLFLSCHNHLLDSKLFTSLLFAVTMIGICVYHYRLFIIRTNNERSAYWVPFVISAIALPLQYYGHTYDHYFGHFLVPAIVMYILNFTTKEKSFLYTGLIYTLVFTFIYPDAYRIETDNGVTFNYGCWIFAALIGGVYAWSKRLGDRQIQLFTLFGFFWFIIQLWLCSWISMQLSYLLIVLYCILLNYRPCRIEGCKPYESGLNIAISATVFCGLFVRSYDVLSIHSEVLLMLPTRIGTPLCAVATIMLLWGMGCRRGSNSILTLSYGLMPFLFFTMSSSINRPLALICYVVMLAMMVYRAVRHYDASQKIQIAVLGMTLPPLILMYAMIAITECWILFALYSLTLYLIRFYNNPTTGEEESGVRQFCMIFNGIVLFIGTFFLRYAEGPLYIGHPIAGTESITTILLILLTMSLAAADVFYLYQHTNTDKERSVSIYQGLKFTILIWVLLCRFASVSYVNSIIGIILAVIFVSVGFRFKYKGLRLYGLCLSMLCVIKLIFFDIIFDNAFYRAGSFLVAGLLLFLISFIYFRLEKKSEDPGTDSLQEQE